MLAQMSARSFGVAATAILLLAALLRFDALGSGLPNPRTRPDELPVVQEMARPARGDFALQMVIYPNAYVYASWLWVEAGLRVAPLVGVEPPGGFQKTLLLAPEDIFWLGRSLSAFAGTAAVLLVLLLARREWGREAGLAAGLLLATCFLHARDSHALKPDALLSFTVLLSLAASAALAERRSASRVAWAGVAFGLAMATKYTGILMAAPLYAAGVMASPARGWRRALPWPALVAGGVGAAVFALTSPQLVFHGPLFELIRSMAGIVLPGLFPNTPDASLVGAGLHPDALSVPPGVDLGAYADRSWYHGLVFHTTFTLWYGVGALATLLAPFAVAWGIARRRALPVLASVACIVHFVVMGLTPAVTARYLTPMLPMLLLLEAGLLAAAARRLVPGRPALALAVATLVVAAQPLAAIVGHNRIASRTDTRVLATRWMEAHLPPGSRIAVAGSVLMPYGQPVPPPGMRVVTNRLEPDALEAARVDVVVVHDHPLYFSTVDPAALAALSGRLRVLADFDPREGVGDGPEPVFEGTDAYYIPFHGFDRVTRPGPHITLYAFQPKTGDAAPETGAGGAPAAGTAAAADPTATVATEEKRGSE